MKLIEILKAILYGIIEGITEWLPVSSTGHLILLDEFMKLNTAPTLGEGFQKEFWSMFEVVIQLGAILAVVVLFFDKLNPFSKKKDAIQKKATWTLWWKVLLASVPAAFVGIVIDKVLEIATGKDIDGWIYNFWTVAATLVIYGVLFIVIEKWQKDKTPKVEGTEGITYKQALLMGCFQTLSIVPGTSRSGSTILGARCLGISRAAAAEFSFFMGIPAMVGGSMIKAYGFFDYVSEANITVPVFAWVILLIASVVAFLVSMLVIRFLMDFVKRHSFIPFGYYRIALGVLVLLYGIIKYAI